MKYREAWLSWVSSWHHLPVKGGRLLWRIPLMLYGFFLVTICVWCHLGTLYTDLPSFHGESAEINALFVDPLVESSDDLEGQVGDCTAAMHAGVLPITVLL